MKLINTKIITLIIVILLIISGAWWWSTLSKTKTYDPEIQQKLSKGKINGSMTKYTNSHYNFSLEIPENLEYCLNDFCINDVEDNEIQYFKIDGYQLLKYEGVEPKKGIPTAAYLEIEVRRNSLGMSAVDFAKRSLQLNRQYKISKKDYYAQESETTFAGEKAYSFIATGGFEERGLKYSNENGEPSVVNAPEFFEKAGQGRSLDSPHKIIYFDHNGFMYRILIPIENKIANTTINSFELIK